MNKSWIFYFLFIWLFTISCTGSPSLPTAVPTLSSPTENNLVEVAPTAKSIVIPETATPLIIPTLTPIPVSTPTAVSPLTIALSPEYETIDTGDWVKIIDENPELQYQQNNADAALILNGDGTLIWQDPIALTVSWTERWEMVSWEEAQQLIQDGDPRIEIMPWREMPANRKALWINDRSPADPSYPYQTRLSLVHDPNLNVDTLIKSIQESLPSSQTAHISAVGDIMLGRRLGSAIQNGNIDHPFEEVATHLKQSDITIGNVESALGQGGIPEDKRYPFIAPPEAAVSLANAGFDVVSLANNHGMDYGAGTLLEAIDLLNQQNIAAIGAGSNLTQATTPFIQTVHDITIAVLAYVHVPVENFGFDTRTWTATESSAGLAWADLDQIQMDVTAVSPLADVTIVVLHSGYEYVPAPSPPQVAASKAAIDAGADLVIGHHAHILQGVAFYGEGVIAYGLGNFAFDINGAPETAVLDVWFDKNGIRELRFTPAVIQAGGQPRFATPAEANNILNNVYLLTTLLNPSNP